MKTIENLSGEENGGILFEKPRSEHHHRVATLRRQPLITHGKGDLQALEDRLGASAYRMSAQERWPF